MYIPVAWDVREIRGQICELLFFGAHDCAAVDDVRLAPFSQLIALAQNI
jgi:hypothetical protein